MCFASGVKDVCWWYTCLSLLVAHTHANHVRSCVCACPFFGLFVFLFFIPDKNVFAFSLSDVWSSFIFV